MRWVIVPEELAGVPVLDYLTSHYPKVRHGIWLTAFRKKDIRINSHTARASDIVKPGNVLRIMISDDILMGIAKIPVLYQDSFVKIIEKPPGLPVMNADSKGHTVQEALEYWAKKEEHPVEIPMHRLDVHTGGTLLLAKNKAIAEHAKSWFTPEHMLREYRAVVVGVTPPQIVALHYGVKDAKQAQVTVYDRPAPGRVKMKLTATRLASAEGLSYLSVQLQTGKTHQIRAQLNHLGYPVLGDDKYGLWTKNAGFRCRAPLLWHNKMALFHLQREYYRLNHLVIESKPQFPESVMKLFPGE